MMSEVRGDLRMKSEWVFFWMYRVNNMEVNDIELST